MKPKLYVVDVEYTIYVLAESQEQAEEMIECGQVDWKLNETPLVSAHGPITRPEQVSREWQGALPYSLPEHDDGTDKTCTEIIEGSPTK